MNLHVQDLTSISPSSVLMSTDPYLEYTATTSLPSSILRMEPDFSGKRALVAGAGSGIGRGMHRNKSCS